MSELIYLGKLEGDLSIQFPSGVHMLGEREGRNSKVVAYALDDEGANAVMRSVDKAIDLRAGLVDLVDALAKAVDYLDDEATEDDWEALERGRALLAKYP